jgi:hypothetical protein
MNIRECRCGIKYNIETINHCPICRIKKEVYNREEKDELFFKSQIRELKTCVSLSRKGKPHKQPSGFHLKYDMRHTKK